MLSIATKHMGNLSLEGLQNTDPSGYTTTTRRDFFETQRIYGQQKAK